MIVPPDALQVSIEYMAHSIHQTSVYRKLIMIDPMSYTMHNELRSSVIDKAIYL